MNSKILRENSCQDFIWLIIASHRLAIESEVYGHVLEHRTTNRSLFLTQNSPVFEVTENLTTFNVQLQVDVGSKMELQVSVVTASYLELQVRHTYMHTCTFTAKNANS